MISAKVVALAGAFTSTLGLTTAGYVHYSELRQEVAENTTARLLQTWQRLNETKKMRTLSHEEWLAWCDAGMRLRIIKSCPER